MKKLKRVVIENFQCHKKTVIEPSLEGLTVITGPTDHGKSAIVRAMKWLLYNRPLGTDFIRHGQTECKVTFEFADGTIVQRRRTTSLNQYYVNGQLYEGFGNGVPLEVQQATGVYIYEVADQTLNLNVSEQLAGPFLGSSISAPLRARILGKLPALKILIGPIRNWEQIYTMLNRTLRGWKKIYITLMQRLKIISGLNP